MRLLLTILFASFFMACSTQKEEPTPNTPTTKSKGIQPIYITDTTVHDTDDPAIWINSADPSKSLILGTDKEKDGGLYVFDLKGRMIPTMTVKNLQRPNNVDVEYGLLLNGLVTDIAVTTERLTHKLRIFSLPSMRPIDGGGIEVFEEEKGEDYRALMGIALYKRPSDNTIFAIVGRKNGPKNGYLWQYELKDNGEGQVAATLVRKFGQFSGKKEIEAIAVDDVLGHIYYSDEGVGVRKYHADPKKGNQQVALFATENFVKDQEGISIYPTAEKTGYIIVSDQDANQFHIYQREGNDHPLLAEIDASTLESDGNEITAIPLNKDFPKGLFVAMSDDKTFQYYDWRDIEEQIWIKRQ